MLKVPLILFSLLFLQHLQIFTTIPKRNIHITVLTSVCAGDAHMLLDKYANTGILPNFFPFILTIIQLSLPREIMFAFI